MNPKSRVWRLALLAVFLGLGVGATVGSGGAASNGKSPPPPPGKWIRTDLRVPTPEQIMRASGRLSAACGKQTGELLGNMISVITADVAISGVLPNIAATQLACAYDAPPQTSCDDIRECETGAVRTPGPVASCVGSSVVANTPKTNEQVISECRLFGEQCFTTDLGATCARGACAPGETYSCDRDVMISCVQGVRVTSPCGSGLHCVSDCNGVVECRGSHSECTASRCEGNTAVTCSKDAYGKAEEAKVDCSRWGLYCGVQSFKDQPVAARCLPSDRQQCDPNSFKATCSHDRIRTCVLGKVTELGCSDLGLVGQCAAGGGAQGEATCRASH